MLKVRPQFVNCPEDHVSLIEDIHGNESSFSSSLGFTVSRSENPSMSSVESEKLGGHGGTAGGGVARTVT